MENTDELEQRLLRLRYKMDDIEEQFRHGLREQEAEEDNLQYAYRKINDLIMDYEERDSEILELLEEEKEIINSFWTRKRELEEQFRRDYQKERDNIEEEIYGLQARKQVLEYDKEGGRK